MHFCLIVVIKELSQMLPAVSAFTYSLWWKIHKKKYACIFKKTEDYHFLTAKAKINYLLATSWRISHFKGREDILLRSLS